MEQLYYTEYDIKKCKLALVNQNLTSLQSAFLSQYLYNIESELKYKDNIIEEFLNYLDNNKLVLNNQNILDFYINIKKYKNNKKGR